MRRKAILFTILPLSNALSLANFQQITSIFIPISCQLTYDSQIPTCKVSDFQDGCSTACQSALLSVANDVSDACDDVSVSSSTLLGIVMNGGILQALCPTAAATTSAEVAQSTASAADSVTIPTTSPGVQLSTTSADSVTITATSPGVQLSTTTSKASKTTALTTHTSATKTSTAQSTETTVSSENTDSTTAAASSTTLQSTESTTKSTSTKKNSATSKTTMAGAASTSKDGQESETQGQGSGGGSPFDISSTATRINRGSMFAFVVAACGCVLLGR